MNYIKYHLKTMLGPNSSPIETPVIDISPRPLFILLNVIEQFCGFCSTDLLHFLQKFDVLP